MARQRFANAQFEVNSEEDLDVVEKFYMDEVIESEQIPPDLKAKAKPKFNQEKSFSRIFSRVLRLSIEYF